MAELTSMLKLVESLIVALVTVGNIEDIQSSSARSLSYSYYPNVKTKMGKYNIFSWCILRKECIVLSIGCAFANPFLRTRPPLSL